MSLTEDGLRMQLNTLSLSLVHVVQLWAGQPSLPIICRSSSARETACACYQRFLPVLRWRRGLGGRRAAIDKLAALNPAAVVAGASFPPGVTAHNTGFSRAGERVTHHATPGPATRRPRA